MRLKELRDLHCSPSVVRNGNRVERACGEYRECVRGLLVGREERDHLEDTAVDWWMILTLWPWSWTFTV